MDNREIINSVFGITESYQLTDRIFEVIQSEEQLNNSISEMKKHGLKGDIFREYFQEEGADRKNLKQDYTPDCICDLVNRIAPHAERMLDMCGGSGALTIKAHKADNIVLELSERVFPLLVYNLAYNGIDGTVYRYDVLKMKLFDAFTIKGNNVLRLDTDRVDYLETQLIISNPPYSLKWDAVRDKRFEGYEVPPKKASDYAFVLDAIASPAETSIFILPRGVLFRGQSEGKIREQLVRNNLIDCIISLPPNLFMNTSVPVCIIVFNKNKKNDDIFFINAEDEFKKDKSINIMTDESISKISDAYWERQETEGFSRVVSLEEIEYNDFNLNIPRYVYKNKEKEPIDLKRVCTDIIETERKTRECEGELAAMINQLQGYTIDISELVELWREHEFKKT